MKVLVACEFSQVVCKAFRDKGHEAYSCDILPTEGNPEWHIQDDVLKYLDDDWDLMIAHPPCKYLCRNRARLSAKENQEINIVVARKFFMAFVEAPIKRICVENPVPSKIAQLPSYNQIIQPWQFGHDYSKKTCLWLKNLPHLMTTKLIELTYITTPNGYHYTRGWYEMPRKTKDRSCTFRGIAQAMATQWGVL